MNFDPASLIPLGKAIARIGLPFLPSILNDVVPFPLSLLTGPAVTAILATLGVDPTAPDATAQAVTKIDADPGAAKAALQPIDEQHAELASQAQAELEARLKDVQDARATELRVMDSAAPVWIKAVYPALAAIVIVGFVVLLALAMTHAIDMNNAIIMFGVTTFGGGFLQVLNYYYGSSQGSADKTSALAALASQPQVIQGPGSHVSGGVAPAKRVGR